MSQVPRPYPPTSQQAGGPYQNPMMQQRPPMWPQGGVPQRFGVGPTGQMVHIYQGQPQQPGQPGGQQGPGGQMFARGVSQGPPGMMRPPGPGQFSGQVHMGMPQMASGAYPSRMMTHQGQTMPQQPGSASVMQSQFMSGSAVPTGSSGASAGHFASHNYATPQSEPASVESGRRRTAASATHLAHAHVPPHAASSAQPAPHMGPPVPPPGSHGPMQAQPQHIMPGIHGKVTKKKKRLSDKLLTDKIQEIVPESQAYMELLQFEKRIDETIQRKRLEVQEVLKKPQKLRKKLRIFINSSFFPANVDSDDPEARTPAWELRVEGRLLDDPSTGKVADPAKFRRKFSSFFKSLVIELDKNIYGPENYLVEWHRTATTQETDGFQVKRPGEQNVVCKLHFMLDYQPPQFKLDGRLARLLGIHTQTRSAIIMALWQYIRTHRLQDPHERDIVICDKYLQQIFEVERIRFPDIPQAITGLLLPPEPIIVQHVVAVGPGDGQPDARRTSCYDIEVEVDDPVVGSMHQFVMSLSAQQEIAQLDSKIIETVDLINKSKTAREFYSGFSNDPQQFIDKWLASQCADLKTMTDCEGNPEYDRRSSAFSSEDPTTREAVMRYFFNRIHLRRTELEQALSGGINGGK